MNLDEARAVLAEQHHAVLTTLARDGTPQMSPVVVAVDDHGRVIVSTRQTAFKVRNLRRDTRAWLCVLPDEFYGRWIQVAGSVRIVELPEAMEGLVDYYQRVAGEHPDWDDYRVAMQRDQRVLLQIEITSAGPDRKG